MEGKSMLWFVGWRVGWNCCGRYHCSECNDGWVNLFLFTSITLPLLRMNFKVQSDGDTCIHLVMFMNDWTAWCNSQTCTYIILIFFLKFLCNGYRPISGASMNPARSLGPAIASSNYKSIWVYIVGPIIGAVSGALVYNLIRLPEQEAGKLQSKSSKSFRR
jgi:glycerol uptake facilitator-like aquaporin